MNSCGGCGMHYPQGMERCPKCDFELNAENRSRTQTVDIAHNRQTVEEALAQCEGALEKAASNKFGQLRVIVGGGKIRAEVERYLDWQQAKGTISQFALEPNNSGSFLIKL